MKAPVFSSLVLLLPASAVLSTLQVSSSFTVALSCIAFMYRVPVCLISRPRCNIMLLSILHLEPCNQTRWCTVLLLLLVSTPSTWYDVGLFALGYYGTQTRQPAPWWAMCSCYYITYGMLGRGASCTTAVCLRTTVPRKKLCMW